MNRQLISPEGFGVLSAGRVYHYLGRFGKGAHVVLAFFDAKNGNGHIERLTNRDFESALEDHRLVFASPQRRYPPALDSLLDEASSPIGMAKYKASHEGLVDQRYSIIAPYLPQLGDALASRAPLAVIAGFARKCNPSQNPTRFRTWCLLVLAYGSKWALLPAYAASGRYPRNETSRRLGRHPKSGPGSRYQVTAEMAEIILTGFEKRHAASKSLMAIYRDVLRDGFGCKVRRVDGVYEFYSLDQKAFPTYRQFRYLLGKHYTVQQLLTKTRGSMDARDKHVASQGKFTEAISGLMEQVELDGYWIKEIPVSLCDDGMALKLVVVRIRCVLSGMIVGIGFSVGGEAAEAYRMALFCAAIRKSVFGRLIGLPINDEDWPSIGLSPSMTIDRGPAAAPNALGAADTGATFVTMVPSYEGQSKAVIESSHPRELRIKTAPQFVVSPYNVVELAKREVMRVIRDNRRQDLTGRITPEMAGLKPNPLSIWAYYESRLRSHSYHVPFDDAVVRLLPQRKFTVREDGVYTFGQRFVSNELRDTNLYDKVVAGGTYEIDGYVLPLCCKQAWISVYGRLIEVDAMLPIRDDPGQLAISARELERIHELRVNAQREHLAERAAIDEQYEQDVEQALGRRARPKGVTGRPRKTTAGAIEAATLKSGKAGKS